MSQLSAPAHCIACQLPPVRTLRLSNGAELLRCPRCRLGWWDWPTFDPADLYDEGYFQSADTAKGYDDYAGLDAGLRRTARGRLKQIVRLLARKTPRSGAAPPRLLDIGCAAGTFLDEARRAGWDVAGVEVSEFACNEACRRGLSVSCTPIEDMQLDADSFDAITLWDALEHVRDPLDTLRRVARALRAGGVLALSTGDITSLCARLSGRRWHLFNLPEHLFFFSPQSLRTLFGQVGVSVARVTREVSWVPAAYLRERLVKTLGGRVRTRAGTWERWVVPATLFDVLGIYGIRAGQTAP